MGVSVSTNAVNSIEDEGIKVINEFVQTCTTSMKNQNSIKASDCKITNTKIDFNTQSQLSVECIQSSNIQNQIRQQMRSRINQKALAISQALGLGTSFSNNYLNNTNELADIISERFIQKCTADSVVANRFTCTGSDFTNDVISFNTNLDFGTSCVQNNNEVNNVKQRLVSNLSQSSVAKEMDNLGSIFIFIGLILIAVMYFTMETLDGPIGWLIVFLIIGTTISGAIYSYLAPKRNYYPYRRDE